jgi:hypothetical protein
MLCYRWVAAESKTQEGLMKEFVIFTILYFIHNATVWVLAGHLLVENYYLLRSLLLYKWNKQINERLYLILGINNVKHWKCKDSNKSFKK